MDIMENDLPLTHSVEYVDAMCLEKSIILSDGRTTATITTVDGQALPVTFIVAQPLQENLNTSQPMQNLITSADCNIVGDSSISDATKVDNNKENPAMFEVHFPKEEKSVEPSFLSSRVSNLLCETKSDEMVDESFSPDILNNNENDADLNSPVSRLEDFMDVVTTYKCKFCRFSCPWKAGLMSHIRCCHINEKQNIVTVKAEKDQSDTSMTFISNQDCLYSSPVKTEVPHSKASSSQVQQHLDIVTEENCIFPDAENCSDSQKVSLNSETEEKINSFSEKDDSPSENFNNCSSDKEDSNPFFENSELDSDNENSSSLDSPVERHIFLCGQCSDGFASLDECKQHMIEDHNLKLDQSEIKPLRKRGRPRKNISKESIKKEDNPAKDSAPKDKKRLSRPPRILAKDFDCGPKKKSKKNELKTFRCTRTGCACKFTTNDFLLYHYACHSDADKSFICQVCQEGFELWRILAMHLWKVHTVDIDLYACTDCTYKTFSGFKLNNHKKIHSDERQYVCETCGKGFKQISQLRNHVVIHLDRKSITEKRWYSEQTCDICERKFSDAKCLRKHKQAVHKKLKPYVCTFCGHLSARKAMLELHMRQHTGEKPFVCEHCDYRTGDHNSLRRHRMRHTGAKPYKCPHCPYACIQAISYKTHLRNKHPGMDGLYCCNFCSFKSVSKENFLHHVLDHKRQGADVEMETATASTSVPESNIEASPSDSSPVQMQLTDNAVQQLEGLLPSNVTAAQLIYSCLNALNQDGGSVNLPSGVTVNIPQGVSAVDGTQTITIQLPSGQDLESEPYYFAIQQPDGSSTTVVMPNDGQTDENTQAATDLAAQFADDALTDATAVNCDVILHEGNSAHDPEQVETSVSISIPHVEAFTGASSSPEVIANCNRHIGS